MFIVFVAIDCGSLSVPMNGSSSGNSTVFPNSVHFQCDPGFLLNGSAIRTCQANGTWGGLESLCIGTFEAEKEKKVVNLKNVIVLLQRDGIRQRFAYATEC